MALFKPMVGANETTLAQKGKVAGYVWFTTDDGKFYIDWADKDEVLHRSVLNAGHADTATKDGDGKVISSTYFKKSGGGINGQIKLQTQSTQGYAEVVKNHLENADYGFLLRDVSSTGVKTAIQISAKNDVVYYLDNAGSVYPILTEKNTVTVAQGGTGATTAAGARTNLGITPANINAVSKSGDTMTGDLKIGTTSSTDGYYLRMQRAVGDTYYVSRFYTHGETGAASIQAMKGSSAVNYMYLEEDRTVFKQPVNIGSGGTGASSRSGAWTNIVAEGGIFSGTPVIANASYYGSIWFKATKITSGGENRNATIYAWTGTSSETDLSFTRFSFRQYSANVNATTMSSVYEEFYLPKTDQGLSSGGAYDILTTKSAVKISEGGTSATTATDARANLNVPSRTGSGASGTWNIGITGSARMVSRSFDRDESSAVNLVRIYDTDGTTVRAQLGSHNTGGDGTGALYLIPYPPVGDSWSGNEGLYIGKGILKLDGKQVLTAANYNNYSPTKTGTGASGTWGISISGTAAKATADADGNTIKSTYLKLSGGTLTGSLNIGSNTLAGWKTFSMYRKSDTDASYATFYFGVASSLNAVQFSLKKYDTSGTQTSDETVYFQTDSIYPGTDCGCNLGMSSRRWSAVYTRTVMLSNTHYTTFCLDAATTNSLGTYTRCIVEGSYIDSIGLWVNSDKTNDGHSRRALVIDGYGHQSDVNKAIRVRQCDTSGAWQSDLYVVHSGNYTSYQVDQKVYQGRSTASSWRPLLLHNLYADYNVNPGTATAAAYYNEAIAVQCSTGALKATSVYGAVWNDYAEYRETKEKIEAGRVVIENGDDTLSLATERLMPGANIVSDTFGFAIGETNEAKTPLAVSGRVLAYTYEDRNSYKAGDPVCSGPNGTVSKMTREEVMMYPDRMIGTVSSVPNYETWGTGNVAVNGRIWIRIR